MYLVRILLLLLTSSAAVGLLVCHSWKYRGKQVTIRFFLLCLVYAILRGHAVRYIMVNLWGSASTPYIFSHQTFQIAGEPIVPVVGWIFTIYLSWCLAEAALKRLRIPSTNLFALVCFAYLSTAGICYVVEAAAHSGLWWRWTMSVKNALFHGVPIIGVVDWAGIIFDFLLPFLLVFHTPVKKTPWKYLFFLPFLLHMFCHTPHQFYIPYLGSFMTMSLSFMFLVPFFLALFPPAWSRLEGVRREGLEKSPGRIIPLIAFSILILVTLGVQKIAGFPLRSMISFGPILSIGALSFVGFPASLALQVPAVILGVVHDPRWLAACAVPLFGLVFGISVGKLFRKKEEGHEELTRIIKTAAVILALIAYIGVGSQEHRTRKSIKNFEENHLKPFLEKLPEMEKREMAGQSVKLAQNAPEELAYLVNLTDTLILKQAPLPLVISLLDRARKIDPEYMVPYNNLATAWWQLGKGEKALAILEMALEFDPTNTRILTSYSRYLTLSKRLHKGLEIAEKGLEINASDPGLMARRVDALCRLGRLDEAEKQLEKLKEVAPDILETRILEADIVRERGNIDKATQMFSSILEDNPDSLYSRKQVIALLEKKGKWKELLDHTMELSKRETFSAVRWLGTAEIARRLKEKETWVKALEGARMMDPADPETSFKLAEAYRSVGRTSDSAILYTGLLEHNPYDPRFLMNYGALLYEMNEIEEAAKKFQMAAGLTPDSPVGHYNLGLCHLILGDIDRAENSMREALSRDRQRLFLPAVKKMLKDAEPRVENKNLYKRIQILLGVVQ